MAKFCSKCGDPVATHSLDDISFGCPHCNQKFVVEASMQGEENTCPICNNVIKIPEDVANCRTKNKSISSLKSYTIIAVSCCFLVLLLIAAIYGIAAGVSWHDQQQVAKTGSYKQASKSAKPVSLPQKQVLNTETYKKLSKAAIPDSLPQKQVVQIAQSKDTAKPDVSSSVSKGKVVIKSPPSKETSLKIKGLYIGMDIQTVPALFKEKLSGQDWVVSAVSIKKGMEGESFVCADLLFVTIKPSGQSDFTESSVFAGLEGKVCSISLSPGLVNALFSASMMSPQAFAQQFLESYNIPNLTAEKGDEFSGIRPKWTYTSSEGVNITIGADKSISILDLLPLLEAKKKQFD